MTHLSQLYEEWVTAWKYKEFRSAHIKLSLIYVAIMAVVISVFTGLILVQVSDEFDTTVSNPTTSLISEDEALSLAIAQNPGSFVDEIEYEFDDDTFMLNVTFDNGLEFRVDLLSGTVYEDMETPDSLYELLTDDLEEIIIWLALGTFFLSSIGAIIVARFTLEPIARKMREHESFIANTAHELRNPLAAVAASLEALKRSPPESEDILTQRLGEIQTEHNRLIALSEDILRLAEASEQYKNVKSTIQTAGVLSNVVKKLSEFAENKNVSLSLVAGDSTVTMSKKDFESIAFNVIHNAIKFSHNGGSVIVTMEDKILRVKDEGVGLNEEEKSHVFERFYKADSSRIFGNETGSGLGLSLVKELIDTNGANITIQSSKAEGTEIAIFFS